MNKAFIRESDEDHDDDFSTEPQTLPTGTKNYITPAGHQALKDELLDLIDKQRPAVVNIVSWAAKNGDRSENGDYIYGKKRLREIDKRIHFLTKRLEISEIVDPATRSGEPRIFFGATVCYAYADGRQATITIVGVDELDMARHRVSWRSPIAQALMKACAGDQVCLRTPAGTELLEVLTVSYH